MAGGDVVVVSVGGGWYSARPMACKAPRVRRLAVSNSSIAISGEADLNVEVENVCLVRPRQACY